MTLKLKTKALADYMQKNNHTFYSLAEEMDVAPSTLYRVVKGERGIGATFIVKLLKAFDLDENDFAKLFEFSKE